MGLMGEKGTGNPEKKGKEVPGRWEWKEQEVHVGFQAAVTNMGLMWVRGQDTRSKEGTCVKSVGGETREKRKQQIQSGKDWAFNS